VSSRVACSPTELTPSALARGTYVTTAGMANILRRLEAGGLVTGRPDRRTAGGCSSG
jgi:DNA-binding MarR family transcriptional regulator